MALMSVVFYTNSVRKLIESDTPVPVFIEIRHVVSGKQRNELLEVGDESCPIMQSRGYRNDSLVVQQVEIPALFLLYQIVGFTA